MDAESDENAFIRHLMDNQSLAACNIDDQTIGVHTDRLMCPMYSL